MQVIEPLRKVVGLANSIHGVKLLVRTLIVNVMRTTISSVGRNRLFLGAFDPSEMRLVARNQAANE